MYSQKESASERSHWEQPNFTQSPVGKFYDSTISSTDPGYLPTGQDML